MICVTIKQSYHTTAVVRLLDGYADHSSVLVRRGGGGGASPAGRKARAAHNPSYEEEGTPRCWLRDAAPEPIVVLLGPLQYKYTYIQYCSLQSTLQCKLINNNNL